MDLALQEIGHPARHLLFVLIVGSAQVGQTRHRRGGLQALTISFDVMPGYPSAIVPGLIDLLGDKEETPGLMGESVSGVR